jgi:hypothetical protein
LAWRQSDDLGEAGIAKKQTRAVASFLAMEKRGTLALDKSSVVVVDEVGLLGTRQLNDILAVQKKTGFQLVMIGDPLQMQSVEAGPVIDLLRRGLGEHAVPELGSSVRQKTADEIETTLMFRNGQTAGAIARKAENGTLKIITGGYRETIEGIADLWQQRREVNRDRPNVSISVSAPTNQEAHDISRAIRERRRAIGEIGMDQITVKATDGGRQRDYDLALAQGDRVRLFKRVNATFTETGTSSNIGQNGSVLEVADVTSAGLSLRSFAGKVGFIPWERLKDTSTGRIQLAYGDALTTNTAQGSTVTEHIHAMPSGSRLVLAFGAYTSGSRHREQSFIVTSEAAERAEVVGRRPLGDRREVGMVDLIDNLTRNLSRQPAKESALDMIERADRLRRGTIKAVQGALHRMEDRLEAGETAATLHNRYAENRVIRELEKRLPSLAERLKRYGEAVTEIAAARTALSEKIAAFAKERIRRYESATVYIRRLARAAKPQADVAEAQRPTQRRGRRL